VDRRPVAHPNRSKRALAGTGIHCRRCPRLRHLVLGQPCVPAQPLGAQRTWDISEGNLRRRRLMMSAHPVLAELAWEVLTTPPTDEEIHLLTEVVGEAQEQNPEPAEIETRLRGTRIWRGTASGLLRPWLPSRVCGQADAGGLSIGVLRRLSAGCCATSPAGVQVGIIRSAGAGK
jgi:hypothetical protein